MKKNILLIAFVCAFSLLQFASAQSGMWTWVKGNSPAVFGTMGVSSPLNNPEQVYEGCEWTDQNGNFWLFGNSYSEINTLWKYNPVTNEWTWMNGSQTPNDPGNYGVMGVPSPLNQPRGRGFGCLSWVDNNNNLWMYGGSTNPSTNNHDLWKYDIATNEWTWMSGSQLLYVAPSFGTMGVPDPSNFPGGRYESNATWSDSSGMLWFFGSAFFDASGNYRTRNDMWTYNTNTNEWTWMNGPSAIDDPGSYGTQGVSSPSNVPPARACYTKFKSKDGAYYIFGGRSYSGGTLNDLWKYERSTNEWTWVSGSQYGTGSAVYSNICEMDSMAIPDNRQENRVCWTDKDGSFWLFGGTGSGDRNDLWKYCPPTNEWSFIKGSMFTGATVNFGTQGVAAITNDPGARNGSHSWYDGNNKLYLYSGAGQVNDLWTFEVDDSCAFCLSSALPVALFSAPHHICPGTCTDFTNLSLNATSYLWTFSGANPSTSIDANPVSICYNTPGSYAVSLIATNANGSDTITLNNYITVYPYPPPQGISQNGDTLFANAGAVSYQWYHSGLSISGATDYFYVATEGGDFNVVATDANGCEVEAVINDVIADVSQSGVNGTGIMISPNPVRDKILITLPAFADGKVDIGVYNLLGEKVLALQQNDIGKGTSLQVDVSQLPSSMYFLEVRNMEKKLRAKFLKSSSVQLSN
jgi:PKD repeat protein